VLLLFFLLAFNKVVLTFFFVIFLRAQNRLKIFIGIFG